MKKSILLLGIACFIFTMSFQFSAFASSPMEKTVDLSREELIDILEEAKNNTTVTSEQALIIEEAIEKVALASDAQLQTIKVMFDQSQEIAEYETTAKDVIALGVTIGVFWVGVFALLALAF